MPLKRAKQDLIFCKFDLLGSLGSRLKISS